MSIERKVKRKEVEYFESDYSLNQEKDLDNFCFFGRKFKNFKVTIQALFVIALVSIKIRPLSMGLLPSTIILFLFIKIPALWTGCPMAHIVHSSSPEESLFRLNLPRGSIGAGRKEQQIFCAYPRWRPTEQRDETNLSRVTWGC